MYSRGIPADIRFRLLQILRQGKQIRDIEFAGDGVVAIFGEDEHLAYKVDRRIDETLTELERTQPEFPVRRLRYAGEGVFIAIFGVNGTRWFGPGDALGTKLSELNAQQEEFTDIALFGPDRYILIRGDNGFQYAGVPESWGDAVKEINEKGWKVTQVMEGAGDNGEPAFAALIGRNGYSFQNVPNDLAELWKSFIEQDRGIQCFAMSGNNWLLIEQR